MSETITLPRATVQQALEALEIGYACAEAEAAQYHAAMAGYRPHRHAQMDADVQKIAQAITAITALKAALEQPEQEPVALFTKYGPPTMRDRDFWSTGYATATARASKAALEQKEQTNPWRDAVDDELVSLHMVASDDPRESIRRLIDWHCAVQIDPLVSSAAQELIERGKREAQPEQELGPQDPALDYAHRLAVMLECMLLNPTGAWNESAALLDEYHAALVRWGEANGQPYVSGFGKD